MDMFTLNSLYWVYDLGRRNLSVFVKNSSGTRVKNLMTGAVTDIPKYHGDYGTELRLDFEKILNTSGCIVYDFKQIYGIAGTEAFVTLKKEQKDVDAQTRKMEKSGYDYYPQDWPQVDTSQFMSQDDIVAATKKAEPILQKTEEVKRREQENKNKNCYEF